MHVSRIHTSGGSILRTSRTNPAKDEATLERCVRSLDALGVRYLVCIGGDDTTYGAARIAERTRGRIGVATVPKTIDNDLPLPDNAPTFGFETARSVGAGIIESLMEDARTTDALVPRRLHGTQVGVARARHVQGGRRDAGGDSRRSSPSTLDVRRWSTRSSARS